ncbi:diacylglycerol kinase family protein [Streptomyces sp. NPDC053427]|uniref:diacylglycerol kinase family protein n=1 Tax=Streptomyces sp. NPDC053427 TaxID=3365701 RepID=UPI0037D4A8F2
MDSVRGYPLLVVIDPVARSTDGESVRIARDVLSAGAGAAGAKICLPQGPEEFARALARRGQRRPVVIGDDRALLRVVGLLHKERELGRVPVGMVPVGASASVALSRALGVPTDTVAAARTVLDGGERAMDLLTDDSDGIVLGELRIPCGDMQEPDGCGPGAVACPVPQAGPGDGHRPWWAPAARTARTALALLAPAAGLGLGGRREGVSPARTLLRAWGKVPTHRLRIEADGVVLADLDRPVRAVSVVPGAAGGAGTAGAAGLAGGGYDFGPGPGSVDGSGAGTHGLAQIEVRWPGEARSVRTRARTVTVSGADFHYRADAVVGGPVRTRTWTVQAGAWRLTVPR